MTFLGKWIFSLAFFVPVAASALTLTSFSDPTLEWGSGNSGCQNDTGNGCAMTVYDPNGVRLNNGSFYAITTNYVDYACTDPIWGTVTGTFDITLYNAGGGTCGYIDMTGETEGEWTVVQHHMLSGDTNPLNNLDDELASLNFESAATFCWPDESACEVGGGETATSTGATTTEAILKEGFISLVFGLAVIMFLLMLFVSGYLYNNLIKPTYER